MTDSETLIATIERDPGQFDEHVEDIRKILESGESKARRAITQLIIDVAEVDPKIGIRHPELLERAFEDENILVRGLAVHAVAAITNTTPDAATAFVPHLTASLSDYKLAASAQMDGIRALASIDRYTDTSVSEADEVLASLLHDSDEYVRETVALNHAETVRIAPREFSATLQAFASVLDDRRHMTRLRAAEVLAEVAYEDVEALHDVDVVLAGLKELRGDPDIPALRIEKMINIIEVRAGYTEE